MIDLVKTKKANQALLNAIDPFELTYDLKEFDFLTDQELAANVGSMLLFDCECYINYYLASFKHLTTGKRTYFETDSSLTPSQIDKLVWIMQNYWLIGFNSKNYDIPLTVMACCGYEVDQLKQVSNFLVSGAPLRAFEQTYHVNLPKLKHIDVIEVAPLKASLKMYAGRLHCATMRELPIDHTATLTEKQIPAVRHYNFNDLDNTELLFNELKPQLTLRWHLGDDYQQDLLSRSDAQIAEAVITSELKRRNGYLPKRPEIPAGTKYRYKAPAYLKYNHPLLQQAFELVKSADFIVGNSGAPELPSELNGYKIKLGECTYTMGIGGLHSTEECIAHKSDENTFILDRDVASYYPAIILNNELYPHHLGKSFLAVYKNIVDRRLEAKHNGNKVIADSLKITINGSFGKLGNMYSMLYSPDLMMQVTVTGQLSLLMLIDIIEYIGIRVISANTDGVLIRCPKNRYVDLEAAIIYWEHCTGYQTEETKYKAIYCRDVNNYIAIKEDGEHKVKGVYAEKGSSGNTVLSKNPENLICNDSVIAFLRDGTSIEKTITECKDIRRFVTIRQVKGGGEKSGVYLGKTVRWYYSTEIKGEINYCLSGNKVPNSDNAMPCMELPTEIPLDLDFNWYIKEAQAMLESIGYFPKTKIGNLFE